MIEIYEEKENLNTNQSVAETNKVTADDMNQLRNAVLKSAYYDETNNILKAQNGTELDPNIPRYEKLKNNINSLFKYKLFSKAVLIGGNANVAVNMGKLNTPAGYTFIGLLSMNGGYGDQWQVTYSLYGTAIFAYVKSYYNSDLSNTIRCMAVFVKTDYYNQNLVS